MAASVEGYLPPAGYDRYGDIYNNDPGVYEAECDWGEEQSAYPDTQDFINQVQAMQSKQGEDPQHTQNGEPAPPPAEELPLKGDYQGLGGPQSVPLYSPRAFERPDIPKGNSILTEIFMVPTPGQIQAYNRVILKGKVVENKYRLKWTVFLHYLLVFCMVSKLMPEILDMLDIFVLEIEELFVPKPYFWEWVWLLSVPVSFFGLSACKKSSLNAIRRFMIGSLLFSLLPVLIGMGLHAPDVYTFLFEEEGEGEEQVPQDITMWQGYPYSVLWYAFFFLALQVHLFELYFSNCLMKAWMPEMKKTQ